MHEDEPDSALLPGAQVWHATVDEVLNWPTRSCHKVVKINMGYPIFSACNDLPNKLDSWAVNHGHMGLSTHKLAGPHPGLHQGQSAHTQGATHALCSQPDLGQGEIAEGI